MMPNRTSAVPVLNSASPSASMLRRFGAPRSRKIATTATASVVETMAPNSAAATNARSCGMSAEEVEQAADDDGRDQYGRDRQGRDRCDIAQQAAALDMEGRLEDQDRQQYVQHDARRQLEAVESAFGDEPAVVGMAVYSMYPVDYDDIRTFQFFLWKDMPGAILPGDLDTPDPAGWYSPEVLDVFRLSSKSHWDLPISIGNQTVHFLVSHPTPPAFDGPENRNAKRNFDEIRFWADYIDPARSAYIYDDNGTRGGLPPDATFVIAGDQNADPLDGDSVPGAIQQLLEHPLVNTSVTPSSLGGPEQAVRQAGANKSGRRDSAFDTADFSDAGLGNLRVDYVLPRKNLRIIGAAVFWPLSTDPLFPLVGTYPFPSSDHRLVWIDVNVPGMR